MIELKRWTDEGAPEAIERLLQAAESEQPSAASLASALTSLGIAGAMTGAASGAAASGAPVSGAATTGAAATGAAGVAALTGVAATQGKLSVLALTASLAKWIALGSVVGGAGIVAVHAVTDEAPPPTAAHSGAVPPAPPIPTHAAAHTAATHAAPATSTPAVANTGSGHAPASKQTRARAAGLPAERAAAPPGAAVPEAIPAETLAQEIAGIDRARSLLAAGRYAATSAALDDYERRFPKHHFNPEVLYLRMEAASGAGRAQEARRLAQRLLASYPASPQSEKAKQVLVRKIE